jgi:DNA-binding YbaB/EbfC family protein
MQAKMAEVQEQLKEESVEASAGGGMVRVTMSGDMQLKSIKIEPSAVDPDDVELLEDMVAAAMNEAIRAAQELANTKMSAITGGMSIPGLM